MPDFDSRIAALQPFWGAWRLDKQLGRGSYGTVYRIRRDEFGVALYSALKWIPLPKSEDDALSLMRSEGLSQTDLRAHYDDVVRSFQKEILLMADLRGNSHIVSIEDYQFAQRQDGAGWDILIRMELLTPLPDRLPDMTVGDALCVGVDLCDALALCGRKGILHRDIKPDNIFVNADGAYKLGDFGVARQMEKTAATMTVIGTPTYMAPEVYHAQKSGAAADQYSLGLVLYRLLNAQRIPFAPVTGPTPTLSQRDAALRERMDGKPLPPPLQGGARLSKAILRACEADPARRYPAPEAFRAALQACGKERELWDKLVAVGSEAVAAPSRQGAGASGKSGGAARAGGSYVSGGAAQASGSRSSGVSAQVSGSYASDVSAQAGGNYASGVSAQAGGSYISGGAAQAGGGYASGEFAQAGGSYASGVSAHAGGSYASGVFAQEGGGMSPVFPDSLNVTVGASGDGTSGTTPIYPADADASAQRNVGDQTVAADLPVAAFARTSVGAPKRPQGVLAAQRPAKRKAGAGKLVWLISAALAVVLACLAFMLFGQGGNREGMQVNASAGETAGQTGASYADQADWTPASSFTYEVAEDGGVRITKYIGSEGVVTVPDVINGKRVTSIGDWAFQNCDSLTSVTLPEGLTTIGGSAFYYCTSLKNVTLPEGLTTIGDRAFLGCSGLTSVTLPEGLTSIGDSAFSGCWGLTSITLPEGLTSIGDLAFSSCWGLTSVALPEGLTAIGNYAFYYCSDLTSVTLPASLSSVGDDAFSGIPSGCSFTVPSGSYAETWAKAQGVKYKSK